MEIELGGREISSSFALLTHSHATLLELFSSSEMFLRRVSTSKKKFPPVRLDGAAC